MQEGYANILCDLDILKNNKISFSWNTIRVGQKYGLLNNSQISDYAIDYLIHNSQETNKLIRELSTCGKKMFIDDMVREVADLFNGKIKHGDNVWMLEMRKLRFCILMRLQNNASDKRELLDKIAQVYEDFDFPEDMEIFINYMPPKNNKFSFKSKEPAMERLVRLFKEFLNREKNFLSYVFD